MYSGEIKKVTFRIVKAMISDVIDIFGSDVRFTNETDTHVTVTTMVNIRSMMQFAKNYAPDVVVLKPKSLRNELKEAFEEVLNQYV